MCLPFWEMKDLSTFPEQQIRTLPRTRLYIFWPCCLTDVELRMNGKFLVPQLLPVRGRTDFWNLPLLLTHSPLRLYHYNVDVSSFVCWVTAKDHLLRTVKWNSSFFLSFLFTIIPRCYSSTKMKIHILASVWTYQMVLIAQVFEIFLKTQQRFSVFGTCFDVSNIIIAIMNM